MLLPPASTLQRAISSTVAFCAASSCAVAEVNIDFFETRIRPLFANHCYECHSADAKKLKGGLRLDTRESILRGGETGAILIPGKPEESALISAVRYADKDLQMPPPKDELSRKLSELQINDLTEWIRFGAPMPADADVSLRSSADAARGHWAFRAPVKPMLPAVRDESWIKTDIDRFVLAEIEKAGLRPAPPADPRSLIRRMTFDLTGLPPTSAEVQAFVEQADRDPQSAIRTLIERLLASPRYGERWGRYWLDLARYADTKGYVYAREERFFVHAHAYRDWVIRAFNEDLPFDRFLLLQIAAEQLVPPDSPDLAAMGFLTGGRRFIGVTHDIIDDRIDVVTRGAMGLTVQCARCHDHKYDPIPARDYYALYGVFHNAVERLVRIKDKAGAIAEGAAYEKEQQTHEKKFADTMRKRREEASARLRKRAGEYLAAQLELHKYPEEGFDQILTADDLIPASVRRWRDFLQQSEARFDPIFLPWHRLAKIPSERFEVGAREEVARLKRSDAGAINPHVLVMLEPPPLTMRELAQRYGELFARIDQRAKQRPDAQNNNTSASETLADPGETALHKFLYDASAPTTVPDVGIVNNELFFPTSVCEELWKLQGEVDRSIIKSSKAPTYALILADGDPEPNPRVLRRGNPARRGEEVTRRFLSIIAGPDAAPFQNGSGRLELARAIVDPKNPLTARVMANRIWLHHFGTGLVRTPSDFGLRAAPPSHPELLDWLAMRFIAGKWSVKQMHRLIVSSAVYQQASSMVAQRGSQAADSPKGASTGFNAQATDAENQRLSRFNRRRLDFEQFRDALLAVSGELDPTMGGKPLELLAPDNKRRTVYSLVDRQFLPGTFRVFDFANPDLHIAQRHATVVPQQALFFLNNDFVAARARALARRPEIAGANSTEERVHHLMHQVFQRRATAGEIAAAEVLIAEAQSEIPPEPPKIVESAWQYGWGEYDTEKKRVRTFRALPHFTGDAWQGGPALPDAKLGWLQLTAEGGHPGNDLQHAIVRRWVAPRNATIAIAGSISHEPQEGDGIHAFIVHSRHGELHSSVVHHRTEEIMLATVEIKKGEVLDFVVHIHGGLNSDQFKWTPLISVMEPATDRAATSDLPRSWNAKTEFAGPRPSPRVAPLTPWEQYAQVLLLSNEFAFID